MTKNKTDLRSKVQAVRDDLNANLLEREEAVEAALIGLLTANHVLMLGPPGVAKSLLVRSICERIEGATYWERLLTRFSTVEEVMGSISIQALERGCFERETRGTLVEAHIGFLDECYKANSSILNCLLGIMGTERLYHESGIAHPVPLLSLFGASNELPEDDSLAALHDRFLVRVTLPYLADDASVRALLDHQSKKPSATITLDDLRKAQDEVSQVELTDDAREAILTIKRELEMEGVAASDRRWKDCTGLVRARAWMEGEAQATSDSCEILLAALWSEPDHIRLVDRIVSRVSNPLNLECIELLDAAEDLFNQRPKPNQDNLTEVLEPLLRQLGDIHTRLENRIAKAPEKRTYRAKQALTRIENWNRELSTMALRTVSRIHLAPGS